MRPLLAALVLANLLALAWWQGWVGDWLSSAGLPAAASGEISPDRLRVVSLERLRAAASGGLEAGEPIPAAGPGSGGGASASREPNSRATP